MSWWGKLIGGAFGFLLGGPLGALLGAAFGHSFDRGLDGLAAESAVGGGVEYRERTQTAFFTATFSVMGHVAKADGRVTPDEIRLASELMEQMSLPPEMRRVARRLFAEGKAADFPLDGVLEQLRRECHRSRNLIRMFVEIQLHAAYADGLVHPDERRVLLHICERLHVSPSQLDELERLVQAALHLRGARGRDAAAASLEDAYQLLNIPRESTNDEVKRAYRRLMSRHHPDKLVAKGLPDEMMKLATEKTKEITLAYDRIMASRRH